VAAVAPRRSASAAALLALLSASCAADGVGPSPTTGTGSAAPTSTGAASITTGGSAGVAAVLLEVLDGDSLLVSLDGVEEEVRLLGVNAPERGECFDSRSREAAAALLEATPLLLEVLPERDQFDRLLAYAWAGGALVNYGLLEAGYAIAVQNDHPRLAEFLEADQRAFSNGAGLWAPAACGTPSGVSPALVEVEADPPGPDEEDLNGEWVVLANESDQVADLSGWTLRDESSEHRYAFPSGAFLRPGEQVVVHTGCGRDGAVDLYWCTDGPVWNNAGDTAILLDPMGNVAARLRYPG
jgi:micrococcal nuclease